MFKRLTRLAPVLLIILLPWFFYWFLSGGKHKAKPIGFFGPKKPVTNIIDGKEVSDTIYHTIKDFSLLSIDGKKYSSGELTKYFHVIGVFNTGNRASITLFEKLYFLQEEVAGKSDVRILTITNRPHSDSLATINRFIRGKIMDRSKWFLLTGTNDEVKEFLTQSLFVPFNPEREIVSDELFLVDKDKRIRGIYDGTDEVDLKRLFDELKVLRLEYALRNKAPK